MRRSGELAILLALTLCVVVGGLIIAYEVLVPDMSWTDLAETAWRYFQRLWRAGG
jgi:hypothetical protein